ncbi:hypothetical protein LTR53_019279, partial [Teratosphaeriaceae sp. CCFEE 6253]
RFRETQQPIGLDVENFKVRQATDGARKVAREAVVAEPQLAERLDLGDAVQAAVVETVVRQVQLCYSLKPPHAHW